MKTRRLKTLEERAATRRELESMRRKAGESPELRAYLDRLKPSKCSGCEALQFTLDGKPMFCLRCARRALKVSRPSVPMQIEKAIGERK